MSTATVSSPVWIPGADAAYMLEDPSSSGIFVAGDYFVIKHQDTAENNERVIVRCGDKLMPALVKVDGGGNPVFYPLAGSPFALGSEGSVEIIGKIQGILFSDVFEEEDE